MFAPAFKAFLRDACAVGRRRPDLADTTIKAHAIARMLQRARAPLTLEQIGDGRPVDAIIDCYPQPRGPKTLHLRRARLALVLGIAVPDQDVVRILRGLGLGVTPAGDGWDAARILPRYRA